MRPIRPPPPKGPWLSTKSWRRAMRIALERGLSPAERRALMARLARVRGEAEVPPQRLRLLQGGGAPPRPISLPRPAPGKTAWAG